MASVQVFSSGYVEFCVADTLSVSASEETGEPHMQAQTFIAKKEFTNTQMGTDIHTFGPRHPAL